MRKVLLLHAVLFLGTACANLLEFNVTIPVPEQRVPGATPGSLGELLPLELLPPIPMNLRQSRDFAREDVGDLHSVRLTQMRLSLTDESPYESFNFIDSIQVDARPKNSSRIVHVAGLSDVPSDVRVINLRATRNQLLDIVGTDFELIVTFQGRFPPQEARFDGRAIFQVSADPQGLF